MLSAFWIDQLAAKQLEAGERALFVRAHQPAIAGDVGGENSRELAFGLRRSPRARFPKFLSDILPPHLGDAARNCVIGADVNRRSCPGSRVLALVGRDDRFSLVVNARAAKALGFTFPRRC